MNTHDPITKWIRLVLAAVMAIAVGLVISPSGRAPIVEAADVAPETSFEIDGNRTGPNDFAEPYLAPSTTPGGYPTTGLYYNQQDFDEGLENGCDIVDDPSTGNGGVKVGDGPFWLTGGADPNGKTDLNFIDIAAEKVDRDGDIFDIVYVGYEKCGGTGTWQTALYLDNGDGVAPSVGGQGDYLFIFDFNPSSGDVTFFQYLRVGVEWVLQSDNNTFIEGKAAGDYGEVALNLTELVFVTADGREQCGTAVVSGPAASITGGSLSSQVKDLLAFPPLEIDNCGSLGIDKVGPDIAGDDTTFPYTVTRAGLGQVHNPSLALTGLVAPETTDEVDTDLAEIDATIAVGGSHSWGKVLGASDYDLVEAPLPPGWELGSIECQTADLFGEDPYALAAPVVVYENGAYTSNSFLVAPATLGNSPLPQTQCTMVNDVLGITIVKEGAGTAGTSFTFDIDNGVATDLPAVLNGDAVFRAVPTTGTYTITEDDINVLDIGDADPDWVLDNIDCVDDVGATAPSPDYGTRSVTVVVDGATDDIVCTFTNNQQGRILVEKVGDPGSSPADFGFELGATGTLVGSEDFSLQIGDTVLAGTNYDSGDLAPGSYDIVELLGGVTADPAFELTNVTCTDDTAGSNGSSSIDITNGATVDLAAGDIVTCRFTNVQDGRIVIEKESIDGDDTFAFTGPGALTDSITTENGSGTTTLQQDVVPGSYRIDEIPTDGYSLTDITCVDPSGAPTPDATGALVDVAAGETVTCTFTNTRNSATFTLYKNWGQANAGDQVALTGGVQSGPGPEDTPISTTATAPDGVIGVNTMTVYSGQTIRFDENFVVPGIGDNYTTTLLCNSGATVLPVTADPGNRGGTLVVGDDPGDISCGFLNSVKTTGVVLEKVWIDPIGNGDTAQLTANVQGQAALPTGLATSASPLPPLFQGANAVTDNVAFVAANAGQTVELAEVLSTPADFTTSFECEGNANAPVAVGDYGATLLIDEADTANGNVVTCRFINTRISVDLQVRKLWVNGKGGDAVSITSTGAVNDVDFDAAAGVAGDPPVTGFVSDPTTYTVYAGETLDFSEAFDTGDPAAYDTTFSCNGPDEATDESLTVDPAAAAVGIVCTYTNTRRSFDVRVRKTLIPDTDNGRFDLFINGVEKESDVGDGVTSDLVEVLVGDSVSFEEKAGIPSTSLDNYVSEASCDQGISLVPNNGTSGSFIMPSSLPNTLPSGDAVVICTFTNTRKQVDLTIVKDWSDSPENGDAVSLTASGGLDTGAGTVGDDSNDGVDNDTDGAAVVYAGETITVTEAFTTGVLANYDSTVQCTDAAGDLVPLTDSLTAQFDVPTTPTDITCTFTNTRKRTDLTLRKYWLSGAAGDTADLTIAGEDAASPAEATSTAPEGNLVDNANAVTLTVYSGETIDLDEVVTPGSNYDSTLICTSPTNDPTGADRSWDLLIDPADAAADILCLFINTRLSIDVELVKDWGASPANGDAVALTITGSQNTAADGADSNDGNDTNDSSASVSALAGETISLTEAFDPGDAANYDTTLECLDATGASVGAELTYTDGALTGDLDIVAADAGTTITCTFTNVRKSVDFELAKTWVKSVDGDLVQLSYTGTDDPAPVNAEAPASDGTTNPAPSQNGPLTATVYAGETINVAEDFTPFVGANAATYDVTGFECSGADGSAWLPGGQSIDLTVTAAQVDAAILAGEAISCTFTNTAQRGTIVVVKSIDGVNDGTFDFSGDWSPVGASIDPATVTDPADFSITTDALTGSVTFTDVLVGSFEVSETDAGSNYDGTSVTCVETNGDDGSGPVDSSVLPLTGTIDLDNGETVTCTFTNTEKSTIVIIKDARPNSDLADFAFTGDLGPFTLDDDADITLSNTFTSDLLNAEAGSTYAVNETPTPGWTLDLAESACSNGDTFAGAGVVIDPAPGTTVTCTFVNTANPAGISATKAVSGQVGPWGPFEFTLSGGTFTGQATQPVSSADPTADWTELVEGQQYTLSEADVPGYVPGAAFVCSVILPGQSDTPLADADGAAAGFQFTAVAGAIYDCDITNVAIPPTLVVNKTTVGDTGVFTFDVTPTDDAYPVGPLTADTAVTNPASTATVDLQAGVGYSIAEQASDAWVEGTLDCTLTPADGSGDVPYAFDTITQPGDVISCEIQNVKRARIVVEKTTVPAAAAGSFGFEASWNGPSDGTADFSLADGGTEDSGYIDPDVEYTIAELAAPGFALTAVDCDLYPTAGSVVGSNAVVTPGPGEVVTCEFTNTQRGQVTVSKDAVTAVTRDGTTYSVTYEITVSNESYVDELYTVTDTPDMADNVTITSMVVTGPGLAAEGVDIAPDGGTVIADATIAARAGQGGLGDPDALVYTVVTEFTMTPSNIGQDCLEATAGNGAYNSVTVTFEEPPTTNSDDACVDLPTPDIDVTKVADAPVATQVGATFQYQADYTVTVTNSGEGPGSYTLADLPDFGSGVVDSVTISPVPDAVGNVLEAGSQDVYDVTVLFTVAGDLPAADRDCGVTPTPGQGGYNSVTVTYGPTPDPTDDACVDIPDPDITVSKVATTDTATHVSDNTYQAEYTVTVDNVGDGPGAYALADLPDFGAGANVVSTTVTPEPAALTPIEAGGQDVYTVTVLFTVDGDMSIDERACAQEPTAGQGGYNGVTVTWNEGQTSTGEDCVDIPNPNVDHSKIVVGDAAVYRGDNQWTVTYQIDVTNLDPSAAEIAGPGLYDLTDTFDFGPGVTVTGIAVTPDPVSDPFTGAAPDNVLAVGMLINRNETHTYTVVVDVTIVPTDGINGDCTSEGGLDNAAGLTVATDPEQSPRLDAEACASFSTLTLVKELSEESSGGNAVISDFVLTATLGDTEILSGNTLVTESVPAGDYALAEAQLPGYTSEGYTCGAASMEGQTVTVPLGANVSCTIVNVDLPVDLQLTKDDGGAEAIAGGAAFTYTISVQNVGTRDADIGEPVTMTDVLPAGLVWVSFPATCSQSGQTLTCDIDPALLTAGADPVVITATVRAPADSPSGTYVNQASVTTQDDPVCTGEACTPPPCPAADNNNVDCEDTPVDRQGAIQITKTDDVAAGQSVEPGDTFTYRLLVKNTGVSTILPGLHVTDDLPGQLQFVSVSGGAGWSCNNADPIDCDYAPSLAPGATAPAITVTVKVAASATGNSITNVAVVLGAVDRNCPSATNRLVESFTPACNQVTDDDDEVTPLTANADLAIVKTASVAQVGAGGGFDWTLDITNNGPGTAVNVVIGDLVPSTLKVTKVSSSDFTCGNTGNSVKCTVGTLAVGASGTVTISVTVPLDAAGGDITNVGTVESDTPDPDLTNNSDDATVTVVAQAPPTTTLPPVTLPKTGSDATRDIVRMAMMFLLLGGAVVLVTRRRRGDGVVID